MNAFALSCLLIFISSLLISIFVYLKAKNHKIASSFSIFSLSIALWGFCTYMATVTNLPSISFLWWQLAAITIVYAPLLYANFILSFLSITKEKLFIALHILALVGLIHIFYGKKIFIGNLRYVFNQFYWISWTANKSLFLIFFHFIFYFALLLYIFSILLKEYKNSVGYKRIQLKYIILGSLISWAGPQGDFLVTYGINIYPYSNFLIILYSPIFAYAILRHQLLDIEVIIKKTLIFTGIFASAYMVFASFALLGQIFFERFITANRWIAMLPSVIVVTIILRPLENFLINITDKYLFQKKYDYKELLKVFASEVLTVLELDRLISVTEKKLTEIMKLEYCKMIIADNVNVKIEAALKMPIVINEKPIGALLLGKKKSDEEYTKDDMDILQALSRTLAIAISNANLFDELSKTQVKIAEKDKMATIGTLAAGMAHEIRNPITTIRVFSEYVPDRLKDAEFMNKYRDTVAKEVDKIDHIIQTLIDFSGEEAATDIEAVSLEEAIDELIALIGVNKGIEGEIREGIEGEIRGGERGVEEGSIRFEKEIPAGISKVKVNRKEFDEIILNLTQNAMHAIEGKGRITFKAEEKGGFVELSIIDTGCGMSEETIKHIFSPFFTTRTKGFGLGLFVVKQLVKRNGGIISVESQLGKGTKFKLMFKKGVS